jgi:hypothetical protein
MRTFIFEHFLDLGSLLDHYRFIDHFDVRQEDVLMKMFGTFFTRYAQQWLIHVLPSSSITSLSKMKVEFICRSRGHNENDDVYKDDVV